MKKKNPKPPLASGVPVFCHFDAITPAHELKLWSEQPNSKNPQVHPAAQLDRFKLVIAGEGTKPGNGYRRSAIVSQLSGCVTKGNGMVQMARREGWSVPVEYQSYKNRAEEIRDVAADNELAKLARTDAEALRQMLGELDASEIQFTAISEEEFAQLLADLGGDSRLSPVSLPAPPKMAWVILAIPTVRFGEISPHIETLAEIPGIFLESTVTDAEPDSPRRKNLPKQ